MNKKNFLTIGVGIIAFVVIALLIYLVPSKPEEVNVSTEKTEYNIGDILKVKIENDLKERICFSSCYPYYLEKKEEEEWKSYNYMDCSDSNLVESCVNPRKVKAFEITISSEDLEKINPGFHRIAIPACVGCNVDEEFREDQRFYSNEFVINE